MRIYHAGFFLLLLIVLSSFTTAIRPKKTSKIKPTQIVATQEPVVEQAVVLTDTLSIAKIELAEPVVEVETELVTESTQASYYHDRFTGRRTASGEVFDNQKYTAAHSTLPFGTKVKVTNLKNKKSVILTITDRGPFSKARGIDLSKKAFMEIAQNKGSGVLNVKIEKIDEDI